MAYVVPLTGWTPPPRYDSVAWTQARIDESTAGPNGPWTALSTVTLSPVDSDPANPQARNFSVPTANQSGWYRVVWLDASSNESDTGAVFYDQSTYRSSGVQFSQIVARLRGLSAISDAEARLRLNEAHRELVADAESLKASVTIGETVIGQRVYPLDPDIVQLLSVRVGGYGYDRKSVEELDDLNAGDAYVIGYPTPRGFFAPDFETGGTGEVSIWPTPTQNGQPITGRAALLPPDLVNDSDYPSLPADFHWKLVDPGALSVTLSLDDERFADAQAKQQEWEAVKQKLSGRTKRRVGAGIARVRLSR